MVGEARGAGVAAQVDVAIGVEVAVLVGVGVLVLVGVKVAVEAATGVTGVKGRMQAVVVMISKVKSIPNEKRILLVFTVPLSGVDGCYPI